MATRLIEWALANRFFVLLLVAILLASGLFSMSRLPIDAVPDVTNVQVQIVTAAPALGPVEVEQYLTYPVEAAMSGLPDVTELRSISRYGISSVTVVFKDSTPLFFARQLVGERLPEARRKIPPGFGSPEMIPPITGLGEIFHFTVEGDGFSPMELRDVLDWQIAFRLRQVPGVVEVNAWGGLAKQFHVEVFPEKLVAHGIALAQVFEAVEKNNAMAGSAYLERGREQLLIRGEGLIGSLQDLEEVVVTVREGTPIRVREVARVAEGAMPRRGAATSGGTGETVIGLVQMLAGENALEVTSRVKARIADIQGDLPPGVTIRPYYDRTELVRRSTRTVVTNLAEGGLLVVVVLLLLLGSLRGGLLVAAAIPLSMLFAFCGMLVGGISGNLMSLGAIDFGLIVDGSVVMIDNIVRRLNPAERPRKGAGLEPRHRPPGGSGGRPPGDLRRHDHHHRLPPDPDSDRNRGPDVPADGVDRGVCAGRLAAALAHRDAGPGELRLPEGDHEERDLAHRIPEAALSSDAVVGVPVSRTGRGSRPGCRRWRGSAVPVPRGRVSSHAGRG